MKIRLSHNQISILGNFCVDVAKSLFVGAFLGQVVISGNSDYFRIVMTSIVSVTALFMLYISLELNK